MRVEIATASWRSWVANRIPVRLWPDKPCGGLPEIGSGQRIEVPGRFIEEKQGRFGQQGARQGEAGSHPRRVPEHATVGGVCETDLVEEPLGAGRGLVP